MVMLNPVGLVLLGAAVLTISQYSTYYTIILVACQTSGTSGTRLKQFSLILMQRVVFRTLDTAD